MISGVAPPKVSLIPTRCPKFFAACLTAGITLEKNTPGVSNTYSKGAKYEPGEPGEISFYLSEESGVNPLALAKVWLDFTPDLNEAYVLPTRLIKARTTGDLGDIADELESLTLLCAVAHMRLFSLKRFSVDSQTVTDDETRAAQELSDLPARIKAIKNPAAKGAVIAADLIRVWRPAMFAWVKAWISNYLEIRELWKVANPSLKINREGRMPLIIPKGQNFAKQLRRWT